MTYITTPSLGLELADPTTIQAFETTNVNSNFLLLEAGIVADRVRLTATEGEIDALQAGAGRGNLAREVTASPATLTAIADPLVGDRVKVAAPGTGVTAFWVECIAGAGAATADWEIADQVIVVDTKARLDAFIAAWVADADLFFRAGQMIFITGTRTMLQVMTAAGAYKYLDGLVPVIPTSVAGTGVTLASNGAISATAASAISFNGAFTSEWQEYLALFDGTISNTTTLLARLRVAGTDALTNYDWNVTSFPGSNAISAGQTSWQLIPSDVAGRRHLKATIFSPAVAAPTQIQANGDTYAANAAPLVTIMGGGHRDNIVYDGGTIYPGAGTITGTLYLFGFNKMA